MCTPVSEPFSACWDLIVPFLKIVWWIPRTANIPKPTTRQAMMVADDEVYTVPPQMSPTMLKHRKVSALLMGIEHKHDVQRADTSGEERAPNPVDLRHPLQNRQALRVPNGLRVIEDGEKCEREAVEREVEPARRTPTRVVCDCHVSDSAHSECGKRRLTSGMGLDCTKKEPKLWNANDKLGVFGPVVWSAHQNTDD